VLSSTSSSSLIKHSENIDLKNIRETLPKDWTATNTHNRRLIFHRSFKESSWTHPNANYESKEENKKTNRDDLEERRGFKALSYYWCLIEAKKILLVEPANSDNVADPLTSKGVYTAFHIAPPGIIQPNPAYYMPNPSGRF
jgi:hypothetical protein